MANKGNYIADTYNRAKSSLGGFAMSFDSFEKEMKRPSFRNVFYDELSKKDSTLGSYDDYEKRVNAYYTTPDYLNRSKQSATVDVANKEHKLPRVDKKYEYSEEPQQQNTRMVLNWKSKEMDNYLETVDKKYDYYTKLMKDLPNKFSHDYQVYAYAADGLDQLRKGIKAMRRDGGFFTDLYHGLTDEMGSRDFRTAGVNELIGAGYLFGLSQKFDDDGNLKKGEKLKDRDYALLEVMGNLQWLDENADYDLGYSVGKGAGESIPFMAQFMATGGISSVAAKGIAKVLGRASAKMIGKQVAKKSLGGAVKKAVKKAAGQTVIMPMAYSETLRNKAGQVEQKEDGSYGFDPDTQMSWGEAIRRGYGGTFVENFTERLGGEFIGKAVGSAFRKTVGKKGLATLGKYKPVRVAKTILTGGGNTKVGKWTAFDGFLPEVAEEYLAAPLNDLLNMEYEQTRMYVEGGWRPHLETWLTVATITGMMGGGSLAVSTPKRMRYKRALNKQYTNTRENLGEYFNEEDIQSLDNYLESGTTEQLTDGFDKMLNSELLTGKQKKVVFDYANAKLQKMGVESSRQDQVAALLEKENAKIDAVTNNGKVVAGKNREGNTIFVVGGKVAHNEDGTVNREASDKELYVKYRVEDSEPTLVSLNEIKELKSYNANDLKIQIGSQIDATLKAQGEMEGQEPPIGISENVEIQEADGTVTKGLVTKLVPDDSGQMMYEVRTGGRSDGKTAVYPASMLRREGAKDIVEGGSDVKGNANKPIDYSNIKPIGRGVFGNIYDQFKGKAKQAVEFLLNKKEGEAVGVFHRESLGDIDLPYGSHSDKYGLEHIVEKHIKEQNDFNSVDEAVSVIDDVITNGEIKRENHDKAIIDKDGYRVVVNKNVRDNKGNVINTKNWIVTGFDTTRSAKEKASSRKTLTTPLSNQQADGVTLPTNDASDAKVQKNTDTDAVSVESPMEQFDRLSRQDEGLAREEMLYWADRTEKEIKALGKAMDKAKNIDDSFAIRKEMKRLQDLAEEYRRLGTEGRIEDAPFSKSMSNEQLVTDNERFNADLDRLINGRLPKGYIFQLGRPMEVLQSTGMPDLPIELGVNRLSEKAIQDNHLFDVEAVKDLPNAINNPLAIFEYGDKTKSQNIITEIDYKGKQLLVGIHFNQSRRGLEVNDIRGLFPKDNAEWLNWVNQNKLLYVDKKRVQTLIAQQQTNLAEVDYLDLNSATNIIKDFNNPKTGDIKVVEEVEQAMSEIQAKSNGIVNVKFVRTEGLPNRVKQDDNFDSRAWESVIHRGVMYMHPDKIRTREYATAKWIHEVGVHYGIRNLIPDEAVRDDLMQKVYDSAKELAKTDKVVGAVLSHIEKYYKETHKGKDTVKGEEVLAYLSEYIVSGKNLSKAEQSLWDKAMSLFRDVLSRIYGKGTDLLTAGDLESIIHMSVQTNFQNNEYKSNHTRGSREVRHSKELDADGGKRGVDESRRQNPLEYGQQSTDTGRGRVLSEVGGNSKAGRVKFSKEKASSKILTAFKDAVSGKLKGKPVEVGRLTQQGREYLQGLSGLTFKENISFVLNPSDLRHIYNKHYGTNEKDRGSNIPLTDADIENMADVISNPDAVVFLGYDTKTQSNKFSFLKENNKGTYNLLEVYSGRRGNLTAKTFFNTKKGVAQRVMDLQKPLLSTSETYFGTNPLSAKVPVLFENTKSDTDIQFSKRPQSKDYDSAVDFAKAQLAYARNPVNPEVSLAEAEVNTQPTEKQKKAGNYKKGHIKVQGLDITIEQPKGSVRSGVDKDGSEWSVTMNNTYGYFKGTEGRDGDHIDTFLGDNLESDRVFVIDQIDDKGVFDEHKVMLGFNSVEEAKKGYLSNYSEGWQGLGAVTEMSVSDLKDWAKSKGKRVKPVADLVRFSKRGVSEEMAQMEYSRNSKNSSIFVGVESKSERDARANRQDVSDQLLNSLFNDTKNIDYDRLNELSDKIKGGRSKISSNYIRESRETLESEREAIRSTLIAEAVGRQAGRDLGSTRTSQSEQEIALTQYAKDTGKWLEQSDLDKITDRRLPSGTEADVYKSADGKSVVKVVNYAKYSQTPLDFINNRVSLFNSFFKDTAYEIIGYTKTDNGFSFVLKQPYINGTLLNIIATRTVDLQGQLKRLSDYVGEELGMREDGLDAVGNSVYRVMDLHLKNAIEGTDGNLYVIDAIPELKDKTLDNSVLLQDADDVHFSKRGVSEEMAQIKATAKANGTFMKAPNGKATKLNERQWTQVRTQAFKKWFGDWEKWVRIEKLRNAKSIEISGKEITPSEDLKQYKRNALEYGLGLRKSYTNKDTGRKIELGRKGVKEVLNHDYKDVEHLQSIAAIPQIIESAVYIDTLPNEDVQKRPDIKEYEYYVTGLKIGGVDYTVRAVVAVSTTGDKYYDHKLTQIEKGDLLSITSQTTPQIESNALSEYKDKRLVSILQNDASKVVDENGEPLVVYHGTGTNFNVFDSSLASMTEQYHDDFIYFTPYKKTADTYAFFSSIEKFAEKNNLIIDNDYSFKDNYVDYEAEINEYIKEEYGYSESEIEGLSVDEWRDKASEFFDEWQEREQNITTVEAFLNIKNPFIQEEFIPHTKRRSALEDFTEKYSGQGFDGAWFKKIEDSKWHDGVKEGSTIIASSPNQIKSATDNVGTFDGRNDDVRFSKSNLNEVNSRFNNELEQLISGRLPKGHIFELGRPSEVLQSAGVPNLPITSVGNRFIVSSKKGDNRYPIALLKDLPKAISKPLVVFNSNHKDFTNRKVLLTEVEYGGRKTSVVIEINDVKNEIEVNNVVSIHQRNTNNYVNWINNKNFTYVDKERTLHWISSQYNSDNANPKVASATKVIENFENPKLDEGVRFSIGKRARATYEGQIRKKNPNISDVQLKESLDFLHELEDSKENTKAIKIAVKWLGDGTIVLPYGMENVRKAIALAEKHKIDPMQYKSPMDIIDTFYVDVEYGKEVHPDELPQLTGKRTVSYDGGEVTIYDVEDSEAGQRAITKILHHHLGYSNKEKGSRSPWCLATFTRKGTPTKSAKTEWFDRYNSVGKKIAFEDGKPIAFMAHNKDYEGDLWWDLEDMASNNLPLPNGEWIMPDGELTDVLGGDYDSEGEYFDSFYDDAEYFVASRLDKPTFMGMLTAISGEYENRRKGDYFSSIFLLDNKSLSDIFGREYSSDQKSLILGDYMRYFDRDGYWKDEVRLRQEELMLETMHYDDTQNIRFSKSMSNEELAIINKEFNADLDRLINGRLPKGYVFEMGRPNAILQGAGMPNLPIELSAERLKRKSEQANHRFDLANVKNLPQAIQEPIMVFDSTKGGKSKVVLTELTNGMDNFIAVMRVRRSDESRKLTIDVNSIRSLYPKDHFEGVLDWINSGKLLLYSDKKKALDYISTQSTNLIAGGNKAKGNANILQKIDGAKKRIENFENPKLDNEDIRFSKSGKLGFPDWVDIGQKELERMRIEKEQAGKYTRKERLRERIFDTFRPVERLQKEVEALIGRKLTDGENVYEAENRRTSIGKRQNEVFRDDIYEPMLKSIEVLAKDTGMTYNDVVVYMMGKHAIERNAYMQEHKGVENGSGIETLEAEKVVKEFEDKVKNKGLLTDLWAKINRATHYSLDIQLESGLLGRDLYKYIKGMYDYYVPLRGWAGDTVSDVFEVMHRPFGKGALQKMKEAKGRKSLADDPIPYISSMAETSILTGGKNEVRRSLLNMVRNHPQPDLYQVGATWFVNVGSKDAAKWVEVKDKPSKELFEEGMAYEEKRHLPKGHPATPLVTTARQVAVWENGEKVIVEFRNPTKKGNIFWTTIVR